MKKTIPLIGYYLGWIYPLVVNSYAILKHYFNIRTKAMGPLDFGYETIVAYIFYSLIFAGFTFLIYFICYKKPLKNWVVLLNLPLYFVSTYCVVFVFRDYFPLTVISMILSLATVIYTTVVSIEAMKKFE